MEKSRIGSLAQLIVAQTEVIETHLRENGLVQPSFEPDAPTEPVQKPTKEIENARTAVIEATIELRQLLEGPIKALLPECNFAPLAAIHRYRIASFVPSAGSISFADLAAKCNLLEHDITRIIRYAAIHHRVFREVTPGLVVHTAASSLLSKNEMVANIMGLTFAECWPAHARVVEAIAQQSEDANVTGYALANDTRLDAFAFLNEHPERAQRFAGAMSSTSTASLEALCRYFDWASVPDGGVIVDVGGSRGHVSVHLAQQFPHLKFVVQDMPEVVRDAEHLLPEDVKGRVSFMCHDMFNTQPVQDADVFLLRYVLHDWSDKYSVSILQQLIPALKRGSKIVIQEHLLPDPGTLGMLDEMQLRSMDAIMLSLFNSKERAIRDWKDLFERADDRFAKFHAERVKENPATGIITAEWDDQIV